MITPTDHRSATLPLPDPWPDHDSPRPPDAELADCQRSLRVLLVDDYEPNRQLLRALLRRLPCIIDEAADGTAAVGCYQAGSYDLIVMDVEMPGMDGHAAATAIRQWERQQGRMATPIVALSANDSTEDVAASLAAGCTAHLSKPVNRRDLADTVSHLLGAAAAALTRAPRATVARELQTLVPKFLSEVSAACTTTATAIANGDWSTVRSLAHQLKGAGGTYGFDPITTAGECLGQAGRAADAVAATRALHQLTAYLQSVEVIYE